LIIQRDDRKGLHQHGIELRTERGFADGLAESPYVGDGQIRIHFADQFLHWNSKRFHIACGADDDGGDAIVIALQRKIHGRMHRLHNVPASVADNAENFVGLSGSAVFQMPANRIFAEKAELRPW
jgi:hypothetical protein